MIETGFVGYGRKVPEYSADPDLVFIKATDAQHLTKVKDKVKNKL